VAIAIPKPLRRALLALALLTSSTMLAPTTASAGTTGTIRGEVFDDESSEPLVGATVRVEGARFGTVTDEEGRFVLLGLPPGRYDLTITMVGYARLAVRDLRVQIDETTLVAARGRSQAIALQEVTVTSARDPIERDVSATKVDLTFDQVKATPTDRLDHFIGFQPGLQYQVSATTQDGARTTGNGKQGYVVRGGMVDETDVLLDGFSLRNNHFNWAYTGVNTSAIKEVQIQTGGFSAEYANARSGLIQVVSETGNPERFIVRGDMRMSAPQRKHFGEDLNDSAEWRTFAGPYAQTGVPEELWGTAEYPILFTDGNYGVTTRTVEEGAVGWPGWQTYQPSGNGNAYGEDQLTPESQQALWEWRHREISYGDSPDFDVDLGFGGPLPLLPGASFYLSGRSKRSWYVYPTGTDPYFQDQNYQLAVAAPLNDAMRLTLTGLLGTLQAHTQGSNTGQYSIQTGDSQFEDNPWQVFHSIYDQGAFVPIERDMLMLGTTFTHALSDRSLYDINLSFRSATTDQHYEPTKAADLLRPGDTPPGWVQPQPVFYLETQEDRELGREPSWPVYDWQSGHNLWYTRDQTLLHQIQGRGRYLDNSEFASVGVSGAYTRQVGAHHTLKAGLSVEMMDESYRVMRNTEHWHTWSPEASYRHQVFDEAPRQYGAYLQDKIEFEGMVVNAGVRLDVYDPNTEWYDFIDGNPFGEIYNGRDFWTTIPTTGEQLVAWHELPEIESRRTVSVDPKAVVSPRLGMSFPFSERAKVYANFGYFYQPAEMAQMYEHAIGHNRNGLTLGNPDLDPRKTVSYEVGYRFWLFDETSVQVAGYFKNVSDEVESVSYVSEFTGASYNTFENKLYRDLRGLELSVNQTFGRWFAGWFNYNYLQISEGRAGVSRYTDSGTAQRDAAVEALEGAEQFRPYSRPSMRLNLAFLAPADFGPMIAGARPLAGVTTSVLTNWDSGGRYQWPDKIDGRTVFVDRRATWNTNMTIEKALRVGGVEFSPYLQIQNLFNRKWLNTEAIYYDRGEGGRGQEYRESLELPFTDPSGDDKYGDFEGKELFFPEWLQFRNPRAFYVGLRFAAE
jgi:outer membrane receptor protein involved in Fe transport